MPELNCTSPGITNCNHEEEITLVSAHLLQVDTLPRAAEVEREDARDVFPCYSSRLAPSPTERWESSTGGWDASRWKSIGKVVAGCVGSQFYPKSAGFSKRGCPSKGQGWGVMARWCTGNMGTGVLKDIRVVLAPAGGPECPFLQCSFPCNTSLTLCTYKQGYFF